MKAKGAVMWAAIFCATLCAKGELWVGVTVFSLIGIDFWVHSIADALREDIQKLREDLDFSVAHTRNLLILRMEQLDHDRSRRNGAE